MSAALNRKVDLAKSIVTSLMVVAAATATLLACALKDTYKRHQAFKALEARLEQSVQHAHQKYQTQEHRLYRLLHDPQFLEHVARERLGYAKPGDTVYVFE
jgi:cell division protein FtsB